MTNNKQLVNMAEMHRTKRDESAPKTALNKRLALKQGHRNSGLSQESKQIYIVERVLKHKIVRGKRMVWIKWKGYSESESTWEPENAIFSLPRKTSLEVANGSLLEEIYGERNFSRSTEYCNDLATFDDEKSLKQMCDLSAEFSPSANVERRDTTRSRSVDGFLCTFAKQGSEAVLAPVEATLMELAVKLELIDISPPIIKPIDEWSIEEVRDYLTAAGYILEAVKLSEEEIDGMALTCISNPFILEQCGIPAESAHDLYPLILQMQANHFGGLT